MPEGRDAIRLGSTVVQHPGHRRGLLQRKEDEDFAAASRKGLKGLSDECARAMGELVSDFHGS